MPLLFWRRAHEVVLYGKPGCHLCEDARRLLEDTGRRYPLTLTEVDIRSDPALFRRYDIVIPVVIIDGSIELRTTFSSADLRRILRRKTPICRSS